MPSSGSLALGPGWIILVGFHVFIIVMLAIDLGVFRRKAEAVSTREAAVWSVVWVILAFTFAFLLGKFWYLWDDKEPNLGPAKAMEFITGYLIELSLSVDNLFVFLVIFRYFGVPDHLRHRVLVWGILGAVLMRALFILVGAALLDLFHPMIYFFAAVLLYTSYRLATSVESEIDPGKNLLLRLARRIFPVVDDYDSPRFWVRREGRWHATPLPLVLLVVESTDVMFALDSIPAIFGVTRDPFIVYTSNIFAILGLRSFYFLLAAFLGKFRYLNVGLAIVLTFVGIKMILEEALNLEVRLGLDKQQMVLASLGVVATILTVTIVASLRAGPELDSEKPIEVDADSHPRSEPETKPADEKDMPSPQQEKVEKNKSGS